MLVESCLQMVEQQRAGIIQEPEPITWADVQRFTKTVDEAYPNGCPILPESDD